MMTNTLTPLEIVAKHFTKAGLPASPILWQEFVGYIEQKQFMQVLTYTKNISNVCLRKSFEEITGTELPKTKSGTISTVLAWAGASQERYDFYRASRRLQMEAQLLPKDVGTEVVEIWTKVVYEDGFDTIKKVGRSTYLTKEGSEMCYNLSAKGHSYKQDYIKALCDFKCAKIKFELKGY